MTSSAPGRTCPVSYRYGAESLSRPAAIEVDTLWVAGGLYGNPFALETLLEIYAAEPGTKALVFNGDFHWFDVDPEIFSRMNETVLRHVAIRGNVETEIASQDGSAGCGCGYPDWVHDDTVAWSNRIIERLRRTARRAGGAVCQSLAALPMHVVAAVGGERVGIIHGDADSLAGWGFSQEALGTAAGMQAAEEAFGKAKLRIFASSHSCLPVLQSFPGDRVIANNGAAGMPNFAGTRFGVATRISLRPSARAICRHRAGCLYVEAAALDFDARAWEACFLAQWPEGSEAYRSYYSRIVHGPRYELKQALRGCAALAA
jgi:hypothetical protein